jgi:hypothetical protein
MFAVEDAIGCYRIPTPAGLKPTYMCDAISVVAEFMVILLLV